MKAKGRKEKMKRKRNSQKQLRVEATVENSEVEAIELNSREMVTVQQKS